MLFTGDERVEKCEGFGAKKAFSSPDPFRRHARLVPSSLGAINQSLEQVIRKHALMLLCLVYFPQVFPAFRVSTRSNVLVKVISGFIYSFPKVVFIV